MAAYTNDLRLKEIATGDESGTWGDSTNTNLELIAEAFSFGTEAITTNADTHATTIADGSTDEGRSIYLKYTGTLDSACTITLGPNTVSKLWFIENGTSGSQNIIISQGSGANVTIPPGDVKAVYSDGAGSGAAIVDAFASLNVVDLKVEDDLTLSSDSAVITFGADGDTTLTHTDGTGLTLNSTNKLCFNDASQFIQGSSATVLSLGATDEIDLTATAIDINGNADISGTLGVTGAVTANAGLSIDNITIDGTEIDLSSGDLTLDVAGNINLNADSDSIKCFDGSVEYGSFFGSSSNFNISARVQDKDIVFKGDDGGSNVDALTLDMSDAGSAYFNNKVGINTTSPTEKLTVNGALAITGALADDRSATAAMDFSSGTTRIVSYSGDSTSGQIAFRRATTGASSTESARINHQGNISFGKEKVDPAVSQFFNALTGNYGSGLSMQNNNVAVLGVNNNFFVNNSTLLERVLAQATQQLKLDNTGNFLFSSAASGTAGATFSLTETMRVSLGGAVHIGTTSEANGSTGGVTFSPDSSDRRNLICATTGTGTVELIEFRNPNGTVGDIKVSGSATSYATSSDGRLKEVTGVARGLDVINELNPVAFNWKVDNKASEGLIAQEVKDLVPDAVSLNEGTQYYQMDYSKLVVHLIAGMKEQQEQINALQSEINTLKGE